MRTQAGVGMSHHRNPKEAAQQASAEAMRAAGIDRPDFVFMFASVGYNQQSLLGAVREATGGAPLSGCSGEGVIAGNDADESNFSVSVMVIRSDELRFQNTLATGRKTESEAAGRTAARGLLPELREDTAGMFLFADGLTLNFDRFMLGLTNGFELDRFLPVFGGTSADNWAMRQTYQYCNDEIASDGAVCTLISGKAGLSWAVNHGCVPIGVERKITKCDGNLIFEIDGKPVLEVLKEYLQEDEIDDWNRTVVNLCLGFRAPSAMEDYDEYLIRFMPAKDDDKGSITISTEVSEGTSVWMSRRDYQKMAAGVERIAAKVREELGGRTPTMVFHFDCAGRGKVILRDQQKRDLLQRLQRQVGANVPWMGFYCYGEIGPVGAANYFHNYTAVVVAVHS